MPEQGTRRRAPIIAVSLAVLALVVAVIAMIVVIRRPATSVIAAAPPSAVGEAEPVTHQIPATEIVKIDDDAIEAVTMLGRLIGFRVTDPKLRKTLRLEADDVITAISGRKIEGELDGNDVLLAASTLKVSTLYVEVLRDRTPMLLRWEIEGDLRAARLAANKPAGTSGALGTPSTPPAPVR